VLLANATVFAYARTVQSPGADRLPGHGPSGPKLRIVRASAKSIAAGTPRRIGAQIGAKILFGDFTGTSREDLSDRPPMAGSKDNSDVSLSNIIEPTMETLSAEDH
jgi:hypothetical protein